MTFLKKYSNSICLVIIINCLNWFTFSQERVEYFYSRGFYIIFSCIFRILLGWIPFSMGDLIYMTIIIFCLFIFFKKIRAFFKSKSKWVLFKSGFIQLLLIFGWTWVIFQVMWGINYSRPGIGAQFKLEDSRLTPEDIHHLSEVLLKETNRYAPGRTNGPYSHDAQLSVIYQAYDSLGTKYDFLKYSNPSFKTSLFGVIGNYMGYGGYYNPISAEAQLNDRLPSFGLPYTCAHEVAHQLGFAKESEANFIGYLAALHSTDSSLLYSANLDLFLYANNALRRYDSSAARFFFNQLSPIARNDLKEYSQFIKKYQGPVDELTTRFYTQFLHLNNQPEGMQSYSRVVGWVDKYLKMKNEK